MSTPESLIEVFRQLQPLNDISDVYLEQLAQKAMVAEFNTNETLLRKLAGPSQLYHYLLEGEIEYRISMMERTHLFHSETEDWCRRPLEELLEENGGSIRAKTACRLLVLSKSYVEELLNSSLDSSSTVTPMIDVEETLDEIQIDDHYEDDWNSVFLNSPLATNLSPRVLHKLFQLMEDQEFSAGETVIKENEPGEMFYLIKSGYVQVSSGPAGPLEEAIELWPGDYFGDESLIANTPRNATVTMVEDGILGCLDRSGFDEILRQSLVKTINDQDLGELQDDRPALWIDVRLPIEFKHDHKQGSINRPVGSLRKHLSELDASSRYFVCANGGCRSELATYLLRQHGLDAYLYNADEKVANTG
jgi:CRP-like cAMP-binding protein